MKTDLYTKIILTVIAVCLTVSLLKEFEIIPSAKANTAATTPSPTPTATQAVPVDVNIVQIAGIEFDPHSFNTYQSKLSHGLPVQIEHNSDK